ncbi:MAG: stage III sporulation protein AF [Christensenellales bacterium]|jgi:stage III sporulation protein AF
MEGVAGWIMILIAAAVTISVFELLLPEGGIKNVAALALALVFVLVMLSPLVKLIGGRIEAGDGSIGGVYEKYDSGELSDLYDSVIWQVYERHIGNIN